MKNKSFHQASEFAELTGVTVRALHHYDRLGLLKPSGRTSAGYRLYGERDFARLQQIVTLKFIGLPLKQIKEILVHKDFDLKTTLRLQREIIEQKRRYLDIAIQAIKKAEIEAGDDGELDWGAFKNIIEVINMQNNWEWVKKYYTQEQLDELASRYSPEVQANAERDWAALIKDVEAALDEDPASERAQALAARWSKLIEAFTGGNPGIENNLKKLYSDQANWPSDFKQPCGNDVGTFMAKAMAIYKK